MWFHRIYLLCKNTLLLIKALTAEANLRSKKKKVSQERPTGASLEQGAEDTLRTWSLQRATLAPRTPADTPSQESFKIAPLKSCICSLVFFRFNRRTDHLNVFSYNRTFPQDLILGTRVGRNQIKNCQVMHRPGSLEGCKRVVSLCLTRTKSPLLHFNIQSIH